MRLEQSKNITLSYLQTLGYNRKEGGGGSPINRAVVGLVRGFGFNMSMNQPIVDTVSVSYLIKCKMLLYSINI